MGSGARDESGGKKWRGQKTSALTEVLRAGARECHLLQDGMGAKRIRGKKCRGAKD